MTGYPKDWPHCQCGKPVMDGHLTCGEATCNESEARDLRIPVVKMFPRGSSMAQLQMGFDLLNLRSETRLYVSSEGIMRNYAKDGTILREATLREVYGDRAVQLPTGEWRLL